MIVVCSALVAQTTSKIDEQKQSVYLVKPTIEAFYSSKVAVYEGTMIRRNISFSHQAARELPGSSSLGDVVQSKVIGPVQMKANGKAIHRQAKFNSVEVSQGLLQMLYRQVR